VTDIVSHRPSLQQPSDKWAWGVWLIVVLSLCSYFGCVFTDPGWLEPGTGPSKQQGGCCGLAPVWCFCCCCCQLCGSGRSVNTRRERLQGTGAAVNNFPAAPMEATKGTVVGAATAADGPTELMPDVELQICGAEEQGLVSPETTSSGLGAIDARGIQKRRGGPSGEDDGGQGADNGNAHTQCGEELRWCKVCRLYQPLRTKHCRDCGRCVRTHDHHCPWVGSCVGENNRVIFLWFLLFQCTELGIFFAEGLQGISILEPSILLVIGLLTIAMFFIMVVCLLSFHSFLMISNLTTWEHSSRNRISYMRRVPIECVSPFAHSMLWNAAAYCIGPHWCPAILRNLVALRYDAEGGLLWELTEPQRPCCLVSCLADAC